MFFHPQFQEKNGARKFCRCRNGANPGRARFRGVFGCRRFISWEPHQAGATGLRQGVRRVYCRKLTRWRRRPAHRLFLHQPATDTLEKQSHHGRNPSEPQNRPVSSLPSCCMWRYLTSTSMLYTHSGASTSGFFSLSDTSIWLLPLRRQSHLVRSQRIQR